MYEREQESLRQLVEEKEIEKLNNQELQKEMKVSDCTAGLVYILYHDRRWRYRQVKRNHILKEMRSLQ